MCALLWRSILCDARHAFDDAHVLDSRTHLGGIVHPGGSICHVVQVRGGGV